jgi:aminopeptidase N
MIIKSLHEAGYPLAVGMEMFPVSSQAILDEYLANQIDERTFLKESRYFSQWRVDYQLYKPIIDYVKQAGIPLIALNIDLAITHKVVKEGIHNLTAAEQQHLPAAMDFSNNQYRQDLYQIFLIHQQQFDHQNFDYFFQSQLLWDETMAQSAHQYLLAHPGTKLIVLAGNGHLMYRYGIPERLHRRNGEPFTVIIQDEKMAKGIADYVLLTEAIQGKLSPRLGIWLEDKNNQVIIKAVGEKTLAYQAGLKVGDIITQFAGQDVQSSADLKLALFYTQPNSTVTIQTIRTGKKLIQELTLSEEGYSH